ncbi:hypothetical protein M2436_007197 [Streptomyces sp. HB372]|nr:hypothetical protein [Streptomyces sp. HB372]
MGEDPRRAGVLEHPGDAVLGVVRVDGQMGGARLLDGELGDDQVDRPRQDHRDELPRTDARGAQLPGRLPCSPVQFGVRQGAVRRVHGHGVRPAVALFGDEPGPGAGRGGRRSCAVGGERRVFGVRQRVQGGDTGVRGGDEHPQEVFDASGEFPCVCRGDGRRAVGEAQGEPFAGHGGEGQRVVGGVPAPDLRQAEPGGLGERGDAVGRVVLQGGEGVEEDAVSGCPLNGGQAQVVVRQQRGGLVLDAGRQSGERLVGAHRDAYGNGVDEQADHVRHSGHLGGPAGDDRAEDDVAPSCVGAQHQPPGGPGEGAQGQFPFPRERREPGGEVGVDHHRVLVGEFLLAGVVGDEPGGLGDAVQRVAPGLGGALLVLGVEPGAVERVVRRGGQFPVRVGVQEFADEEGQRPAVEDQMVTGEHEFAGFRAADERGAQQRRGGQVEAAAAFVVGPPDGPALLFPGLAAAQVQLVELRFRAGVHVLRPAVPVTGERGAQRCVAADDGAQRGAQAVGVEVFGEADDDLDVVDVERVAVGARGPRAVVLGEEQQPLLERGGPAGGPVVRCGGHGTGRGRRGGAFGDGEEAGDRAVAEDVLGGEDESGLAGRADELDGQDAVAAEGEEAVVDADVLGPQEFGEEGGEAQLLVRAGCGPGLRGGEARGRERGAVELAVGGDGQGGQRDQGGGDEVRGEPGCEVFVQTCGQRGAVFRPGNDVADQVGGAGGGVLVGHHRGGGDLGVGVEQGPDLAGLDAPAAQLDLVVDPSEVLQSPVGPQPGEVAGAVEAAAGWAVGVGDEARRGEGGAAVVAVRQLGSREIQLARRAGRGRAQPCVQDEGGRVPHRAADGDVPRGDVGGGDGVGGDVDGGLGRPVEVVQLGARGESQESPGGGRGEGFAARQDAAEGGAVVGGGDSGEGGEHRRHEVDGGDAVFAQQPGECGRVAVVVGSRCDEGGAGEQRPEEFPDGYVEGRRGLEEDAVVPGEPVGVLGPAEPVGDGAVRDGDALGAAGGAGGEEEVGGVGGAGRVEDGGEAGHLVGGDVEYRQVADGLLGQGCGGVRDQQDRFPVGELGADARGRLGGVERQVGGSGALDGVDGEDEFGGAGQGDGHGVAASDVVFGEESGEPVGLGVELAVAPAAGSVAQGLGGRGAGGLFAHQVDEGAPGQRSVGAGRGGEHPPCLRRVQDGHLVDGEAGVGAEPVEQGGQPVGEGLDGRAVEEGRAVVEGGAQPVRSGVLDDGEGQVELRGAGLDEFHFGGARSEGVGAVRGVLVDQGDLEEGVAGEGALRGEGVDEPFEGQVAVVEGVEVHRADPGEEFGEGGAPGGVGAQDHGVGDQARQLLQCGLAPAAEQGADRQVVARPVRGEQDGEGGLEHHEEGGAALAGDPDGGPVGVGGDGELDGVPVLVHVRGPGPVQGQGDLLGGPGERGAPVGQQPVLPGGGRLLVPEGVVGVLECGGPGRRLVRVEFGGVQLGEVPYEGPGGGLVVGDVVHHEQQGPLAAGPGEQMRAQRRAVGQVEGFGREPPRRVHGALAVQECGRQGYGGGLGQHLLDGASLVLGVAGAQDLVAAGEGGEGAAEGVLVEGAVQPQQQRYGIGDGGSAEAVEEPQPGLGGRQRELSGAFGGRREGGDAGVRGAGESGEPGREGGDGGGFEEGPDGDVEAEFGADASGEAGDQQGVAAEGEEVLVHGDGGAAEDLAVEPGDEALLRGTRSAAGARSVGIGVREGQGGPVELAVGGQRQPVEADEGGRHHVCGEPGPAQAARRSSAGTPPVV